MADTPTWDQLYMHLAIHMLPMAEPEREAFWNWVIDSFVGACRRAGLADEEIERNGQSLMLNVGAMVATLQHGGGVVGRA